MHTEKQAAQLWCPMVRAANGKQATNCAVNTEQIMRDYPGEQDNGRNTSGNCIASHCAVWRWADEPRRRSHTCSDINAMHEPERPSSVPTNWEFCPAEDDSAAWVEPESEQLARRTGYCGLAPLHQLPKAI